MLHADHEGERVCKKGVFFWVTGRDAPFQRLKLSTLPVNHQTFGNLTRKGMKLHFMVFPLYFMVFPMFETVGN